MGILSRGILLPKSAVASGINRTDKGMLGIYSSLSMLKKQKEGKVEK